MLDWPITLEVAKAMIEPTYNDSDGRPCSLSELCRREPEWAASVIERLKAELLQAKLEQPPVPIQLEGDGVEQFGFLLVNNYAQGHAEGMAEGLVLGAESQCVVKEELVSDKCSSCTHRRDHWSGVMWCALSGDDWSIDREAQCNCWEKQA